MAYRHFRIAVLLLLGLAGGAVAGLPGDTASPEIQRRHEQLQQLHDRMHGTAEAARGEALAARFRAEWNRAHPQAPMLTLYDRAEWPMFPEWRTPTFYVVRDGKVVGTVVGWKPADARGALVALLRENGLLTGTPGEAPTPPAQGAASSSL
jgi:hypothetical protein